MNKPRSSLYSHYILKFIGNFLTMLSGAITTLIAPKALGPGSYGIFGFITNFFTQIFHSLDSGSSIAYYTKLSQRNQETDLLSFYFYIGLIINLAIAAFLIITIYFGYSSFFWPNISTKFIILGFIFGSLSWTLQILTKTTDALHLTQHSERIRMVSSIVKIIAILLIVFFKYLSLSTFFLFHFSIFSFLIVSFVWIIKKGHVHFRPVLQYKLFKEYFAEFWEYTSPLITYSIVGLIADSTQRLLLQHYGGNEQQGFFTLANQLGVVCFLFTNSMTPLFHRELSKSFKENHLEKIRDLTRTFIPLFFFIAATIGIFSSYNAKEIATTVGGGQYANSSATIAIMLLYPMHQTYGQLIGSIYYASNETRIYRNIGVSSMLFGILLSFFLIAPKEMHGLNLQSLGVALNQVILQFFSVNLMLYFICRKIGMRYITFLINQIIIISLLVFSLFVVELIPLETLVPISGLILLIVKFMLYTFVLSIFTITAQRLSVPIFFKVPPITFVQKLLGE